MLDKNVSKLLNEQIMKEFFSAYLYIDMSDYYADGGLNGFASWFYVQAQEERDHAMLFRTYLLNNGEKVKLLPIPAPEGNFADFKAPLVKTLSHEQEVTASIHNIYAAALEVNDFRSMEFLTWFVKEQGEEEKNADDLLKKYALFGKDANALYAFDQELATRIYAPPSLII